MRNDLPSGPRRMWRSTEFRNCFYNQHVVILGDSIQRGIYKDLVKLYQTDDLLTPQQLRGKGEKEFMDDTLLRGSPLTNGKEYEEIRVFHRDSNIFKFYFLTKIYSDYVESVVFRDLERSPPDILIVNSCVWDMTRYGPEAISEYKISLERFFTRLCIDRVVPESTEIIWLTTLPLGERIKGGFIVQTVRFMDVSRLRLDVLEANRWVAESVAPYYDINVLDVHYMLANYQQWRELDGLHWNGEAHRFITSALCEFVEALNYHARKDHRDLVKSTNVLMQPLPVNGLSMFSSNLGPHRTRRVVALNDHRSNFNFESTNSSRDMNFPPMNDRMFGNPATVNAGSNGASSSSYHEEEAFLSSAFSGSLFDGRTFTRPFWANFPQR